MERCRQCLFASDMDSFNVSATFNDECRHSNWNRVQCNRERNGMLLTIKNMKITKSQRVNRNRRNYIHLIEIRQNRINSTELMKY